MKFSQLLCPTLKEDPKDAEVISHQLMLRAGLIKKVASGIYSYYPLGFRVIKKVQQIIREEMDRIGAQEVHMPMVIPKELWEESERWDKYGKELLRIEDRHGNSFCLGPTHEEVITYMVKNVVRSYKQLPLSLYQIQTKFRDEIRPRFGLMRGREFSMKDAYSFHVDEADLKKTYDDFALAYHRIFERCGLDFKVVEADSGAIGGSQSAEFMVLSKTGEDLIIECSHCNYAANVETAKTKDVDLQTLDVENEIEEVSTPGAKTISQVADFLSVTADKTIKSLLYEADEEPVLVMVRGDHEANEHKIRKVLGVDSLALASDKTVESLSGAEVGFVGPLGLAKEIRVIADHSLKNGGGYVVGANKKDLHLKHVVLNRDVSEASFGDLRNAQEKDRCPVCNEGSYSYIRGIEVGHIFMLGNLYSEKMGAKFLDSQGKSKSFEMGCYGIGVGRTVAAAIEQSHDEKGIIWPMALAPFHVDVILTNTKTEAIISAGEGLYSDLNAAGIETIFDDRRESAGVKFKDAELIGFPIQVVVGKKFLESGLFEVKLRKTGDVFELEKSALIEKVKALVQV